jgi:hypothetical protein
MGFTAVSLQPSLDGVIAGAVWPRLLDLGLEALGFVVPRAHWLTLGDDNRAVRPYHPIVISDGGLG